MMLRRGRPSGSLPAPRLQLLGPSGPWGCHIVAMIGCISSSPPSYSVHPSLRAFP